MVVSHLRPAVRSLFRSPGFALTAVLTLALGIAANCALFSIVNGILWKPLPVRDPARLVVLVNQPPGTSLFTNTLSVADVADVEQQAGSVFNGISTYTVSSDGIAYQRRADQVFMAYVSGDLFPLLGLRPAAGRLLLPQEGRVPGRDPVLVLGYDYWRHRFGGDRGIVGQTVQLDGHPFTVVGVAPPGFKGPFSLVTLAAYAPLAMGEITEPFAFAADVMVNRNLRSMSTIGRLRPGVSLARAQSALDYANRRLASAFPKTDHGLRMVAYRELDSRPVPDPNSTMKKIALLFLVLAGLLLLLACANVANLLLVRASARSQELAIRAALGAGRARLIGQLLAESLVLSLSAGLAGILLGLWASRRLAGMDFHISFPLSFQVSPDWRVYAYTLVVAVAAGVAAGLLPAWRASRANLNAALHAGSRTVAGGRAWTRATLVIAQVAGSLALLIVAGLFVRGLGSLQRARLGFDPYQIMNFDLDPHLVGLSQEQGQAFYTQLLRRVRALPGVSFAGANFAPPLSVNGFDDHVAVTGYLPPPGQPHPEIGINFITPGVFRTLRIPLIAGRALTDADQALTLPVAVINQSMARRFWPSGSALGHTFRMDGDPKNLWTIVGVVADSRANEFSDTIGPLLYLPEAQDYVASMTLQVRTAGPPAAIVRPVEALVATLAPGMPITNVRTQLDTMNSPGGFLFFRIGAMLTAVLGVLGLFLAAVGVYGVVSFATAQRNHEIGVRMALGAQPHAIFALVLRQGMVLIGAGIALGLAAGLGLGRLVATILTGVSGADPPIFAGAVLILLVTGMAACLLPAQRAMRLDPIQAIRAE